MAIHKRYIVYEETILRFKCSFKFKKIMQEREKEDTRLEMIGGSSSENDIGCYMTSSNNNLPSFDNYNNDNRHNKLKNEIIFLKAYVTRLTNELNFYQKHTNLTKDEINCATVELPDWMISSNVMSPIFLAYDSRISQLKSITKDQEKQLDYFKINATVDDTAVTDKQDFKISEGISSLFNEDKKNKYEDKIDDINTYNTLKNQLRIMKEENNLRTEEASMLANKLENAQKHMLSQDKQIEIISQDLIKKIEASQEFQDELNSLRADKINCEEELFEKVKDLMNEHDSLKKIESDMQSVNNLRSHLIAKIEELNMEKEELEIEVEQLTTRVSIIFLLF